MANEIESISRWVELLRSHEIGKKVQFDCPICFEQVPLPGIDMPKFADTKAFNRFYKEHPDVEKPVMAWCGHMFGDKCYEHYMPKEEDCEQAELPEQLSQFKKSKKPRRPIFCPMCRMSWQYADCGHLMNGFYGPTYEGEGMDMVPPVAESNDKRPANCLSCHYVKLGEGVKGTHLMKQSVQYKNSGLAQSLSDDIDQMEKARKELLRPYFEVTFTEKGIQTLLFKDLTWEINFPNLSFGPRIKSKTV